MFSTTRRAGDCCMLAASCQTAGVLLTGTGLIDSLLPRAIKDLIGEEIGYIKREHVEEIFSPQRHTCEGGWMCGFVFFLSFPVMPYQTTGRCLSVISDGLA